MDLSEKMEALKKIHDRLMELEKDLNRFSCSDINCDECPVERFCDAFYGRPMLRGFVTPFMVGRDEQTL